MLKIGGRYLRNKGDFVLAGPKECKTTLGTDRCRMTRTAKGNQLAPVSKNRSPSPRTWASELQKFAVFLIPGHMIMHFIFTKTRNHKMANPSDTGSESRRKRKKRRGATDRQTDLRRGETR